MDLYIIRHTQVAIKDTCYGQIDVPLADSFSQEVKAYKKQLPSSFDAVYSSPLKRCLDLSKQLGYENVIKSDQLKEMNFGEWEGKKWNEIDPHSLDEWMSNFVSIAPPSGENLSQVLSRTRNFLDELRTQKHQQVLIVTHAGIIRSMWSYFTEITPHNLFKIPIGYGETMIGNLGNTRSEDFIKQKQ